MKMPKHIKMNIDIDTYKIDLNSEKPTLNQYEMNKLEGNQKSGKSIFDVKLNESGKPENDGLVEAEVPKAKPSSKSNSPTKWNKKMRGKQWKNKRRSHVPTDTNPYHQTFEYNHQQQGVHNFPPQNQPRISPQFASYSTVLPCPFLFPPILPLGPISLLPPVQSSPIGNTCPEDVQWRLVPHPSDLLCHPEQMGRVVYRSGHIGEMGGVRLRGVCFLERL